MAVVGAAERPLREIAREFGTDKEGAHAYADAYEHHLSRLRDEPITLLEIGVGGYRDPSAGGASLRMWKAFFPRAHIVGLDVHDKSPLAEDRITIVRGDQGDAAFLEEMARIHGPFDVVIDDGSHVNRHVIASFGALFPHVKEDGVYAIEDLQTAYWETYGGSSGADATGTSMALLKSLADGLNHAEYDIPNYHPTYTDRWVRSITLYHNLAFIQKGDNSQPSHLLAPHPRPDRRFARRTPASPTKGSRPGRIRVLVRRFVPFGVRRWLLRLARPIRRA